MSKKYVVAVDLGATNIRAAIMDFEKKVLMGKIRDKTRVSEGPQGISAQIVQMVMNVVKINRISLDDVVGIGVGAPGPLDIRRGGITRATNIPYDFVPVREPLEEAYGLPVVFMNDANAAALGEYMFGIGKHMNARYVIFITISSGIGAGIVDDGKLINGVDGNAGEVGCITVDYKGKMRCGCGKYGHWQSYCSGSAIPNFVKYLIEEKYVKIKKDSIFYKMSQGLRDLSAKTLYESAKKGDEVAEKIVEELAILNAVGIANVINAYNPEVITLGGSLILQNIELTVNKSLPKIRDYAVNRIPKILPTPLGEDIGLYGAAAALLQEVGKF